MVINHHKYTVDYASIEVPYHLAEKVPHELRANSVEEYARLKDGIEISFDNLQELILSEGFEDIDSEWKSFLKEVASIDSDTYIFHN